MRLSNAPLKNLPAKFILPIKNFESLNGSYVSKFLSLINFVSTKVSLSKISMIASFF